MTKNHVCIVIPAYNEGTVIRSVVTNMQTALDKAQVNGHIVVVNDGSGDNTAQQAREAGADVVSHILNTGAGGATATGLRYALIQGYSIAVTMDADGQHLPKDVIKGIKIISKSKTDLLIGSRLIDSQGMSRVKIIGNKGLGLITKILFGITSTDSQSGLRVFSHTALNELRWKTSGYEFCSEMLWRAKQIGLTIDEFSIDAIYTDYSKGKGQNNWNGINIVRSLIKRRFVEMFE